MAEKLHFNAEDFAAANLGFQLVQVVIDMLIKKKVLESKEVLEVLQEMEKFYRRPGNPQRLQITSAAAGAAKFLATKYDVPPPEKQH
ncbi:MAG: hypothetical protein EPO64_10225 [Nitrospirae bacterium]|nr:MAG: hypothetical protein EPO64_10225 [Nitrospirota bacterium]